MFYAYFTKRRTCGGIGRLLRVMHSLRTRSMIAALVLGFVNYAVTLLSAEARGGVQCLVTRIQVLDHVARISLLDAIMAMINISKLRPMISTSCFQQN